MATIRQYRPDYFTEFENEEKSFNSLEDLFNIEFVHNFRKLPNFFKYSVSIHPSDKERKYTLMAEYRDGYDWYVIGFMSESEVVKELPNIEFREENI